MVEANELSIVDLDNLMESAKRNMLMFPYADKTIKDTDVLLLLDKNIQKNISLISAKFLISEFILEFLKMLNELIRTKYAIPQLTLDDFVKNDQIVDSKQIILKLKKEDIVIVDWLKKECLEELKNLIDNIGTYCAKDIVDLGNAIFLLKKELLRINSTESIELFDIVYRFISDIEDLGLLEHNRTQADYLITVDGDATDISKINPNDLSIERKRTVNDKMSVECQYGRNR